MGSQGGVDSNSIGGTQTQEPTPSSLARQGSLYSLTFDEVQHHLGDLEKPLSSMNLDELLKTVWTVEANQGFGGVDSGVNQYRELHVALNQQSSLTLSRDLSKKTVDEVWHDIQQGQISNNHEKKAQDRQITLGEITLEDFLVKAGVVAEPALRKNSGSGVDAIVLPQQIVPLQSQWIPSIHWSPPQQQQQNLLPVFIPGHPVQQPLTIGSNHMVDADFPESQITMSPSTLMGTLSETQTQGRKRAGSTDVIEKTVERRQKRMIKNRESAARSRARKQAYTHELENKVTRLEEENERLKRQREMEKALPIVPPPEPKYQLRRTSSGAKRSSGDENLNPFRKGVENALAPIKNKRVILPFKNKCKMQKEVPLNHGNVLEKIENRRSKVKP